MRTGFPCVKYNYQCYIHIYIYSNYLAHRRYDMCTVLLYHEYVTGQTNYVI